MNSFLSIFQSLPPKKQFNTPRFATSISKSISKKKPTPTPISSPKKPNTTVIAEQIINDINKIRKEHGLPPLKQDRRLNNSASKKANDMVKRNYWDHKDPDGKMPWQLIQDSGFNYIEAAENLSRKYDDQKSVEAWMKSPTHRDNILSPKYDSVGIGRAGGYNVMHFGKE